MKNTRTSVIVPAYNEETAIRNSLDKIVSGKFHEKYEVIYINDGSTDNTAAIIREYPVKMISHTINKGYGAALKTGVRRSSGEKIIFMDSDGQHEPKYIEDIDKLLDEYDLVIGERTSGSFQVRQRVLGKKIIRRVGEFLVEQKLPDYNSGFRGFKKEYLLQLLHIMPNGFSFTTTSTLAFMKEGYNIKTIPIVVTERIGRPSNVRFFKDGTKVLMLLFRIIMLFNPLKIFFPASIGTFLIGFGFGLYGYLVFSRFSNGGLIMIMLGMFLFFIGLLADQIAIMNRKKS